MRKALLLSIPFAYLVVACTYDNGDAQRAVYDTSTPASCETPTQSTIDTDAQISVDAGVGAGVFIEYATGGHYPPRTGCDPAGSNPACHWDVIITPEVGKTITNVAGENLDGADNVHVYAGASAQVSYQLSAETSTEI